MYLQKLIGDKMAYEKELERIKNIITTISSYPVAITWEQRENLKKELLEIYNKGDDFIKGAILGHINEKLSNVKTFRDFISVSSAKEKSTELKPEQVMLTILDYSSSVDGIGFFIDLLKDIDDNLSLKMLSYHLTRYLSYNTQEARLLSLKIIKAFHDSKNPYAAHVLLELIELTKDELQFAVVDGLSYWEEKLKSLKISSAEKKFLKAKIEDILKFYKTETNSKLYG
jgi:hypothetical protein